MADIRRLLTKPERLRAEQAARLRQTLSGLEVEVPRAVWAWLDDIDRRTACRDVWVFVMISPQQHLAVTEWLLANSTRPMKALHVWSLLFAALDKDTGEITLTRDEIAERVGIAANDVSAIMGELTRAGAVTRCRVRIPGMRGPGRVCYSLNPNVGTHLAGAERAKAQAAAPPGPLHVIEGARTARDPDVVGHPAE